MVSICRNKHESEINSKDLTLAELRIKQEEQINKLNLSIENLKSQNEQLKVEIEYIKKNESNLLQKYQDQLSANSVNLKENETLKNNLQNLQNSFDAFKEQSKSQGHLIDDTNNQVNFNNC